jgi:WD40 repeat protein
LYVMHLIRYHPSGLTGASGSEDATIRIWDTSLASSQAAN